MAIPANSEALSATQLKRGRRRPVEPGIQLTPNGEAHPLLDSQQGGVPKIRQTPREEIENAIEDLIAALDEMDSDSELEPYLAGIDGGPTDDREGGADDQVEGDGDLDLEPTLGSPEIPPTRLFPGGFHGWHVEQGSQEYWADGLRGDHEREEENEHGTDLDGGERDQSDDEPEEVEASLGWTNAFNQASAHRVGPGGSDWDREGSYDPRVGLTPIVPSESSI